jgi:micrococcal nuclease
VSHYRQLIILSAGLVALCSFAACAPLTLSSEATMSQPAASDVEQPKEESLSAVMEARVTRVVSGDTIEAAIADTVYKVRYIGMNIPLSFQANKPIEYFQNEAWKKNCELVEGKTVRLEKDVQDTDKEGRLLRYVWLDTLMVNAEFIRLGYMQAIHCPPNTRYEDIFVDLEREAQNQGRGLWVVKADAAVSGAYVGSRRSLVYHYPSCKLIDNIGESNKVYFVLPAQAAAKGYIPCKVCNPPSHSCSAGACGLD